MNRNLILKVKEPTARQQSGEIALVLQLLVEKNLLRLENYYLCAYLWYLFAHLEPYSTDNLGRNDSQLRTTSH